MNILFLVADKTSPTGGEAYLKATVLEGLGGHVVTYRSDEDTEASQDGYDCAIISDSCNAATLGTKYTTNWTTGVIVGGPMWVSRGIAGTVGTSTRDQLAITTGEEGHALAAGLTSPTTVFTSTQAINISTSFGDAHLVWKLVTSANYAIFAYEAGKALVGGAPAPGRRVGMGLKEASWSSLTADSQTIWLNAIGYSTGVLNTPPTLTINEAGQSLPTGASFDYTATATDAQDGDLTAAIAWSVSDAAVLEITGATTGGSTTVKKIGAGSAQLLADVSDSNDTAATQASVTISNPSVGGGFDRARFIIHALGGIV